MRCSHPPKHVWKRWTPGTGLVTWHRHRVPADGTACSLGTGRNSAGGFLAESTNTVLCASVIGNRSWVLGSGLPAPSLHPGSVCPAHPYDWPWGLWDKGLWPCLYVGQLPSPRGFNPWHLYPLWRQARQGGIPAEWKQEGARSRTLRGSHLHSPEQQHHSLPIQKGAAPMPYATQQDRHR